MPLLVAFLSLLLALSSLPTSQAMDMGGTLIKHGLIGYGISMYHPVCGYACSDALSSLYLNCTVFSDMPMDDDMGMSMKLKKRMDMGGDQMATTSDECRASDRVWLQTFSYCVSSRCTLDGVSQARQQNVFALLAAGGLDVLSIKKALPSVAPNVEVASDALWLNTTQLVNEDAWAANYRTLVAFEYSEDMHSQYGIIIYAITVGIPLTVGAWTWLSRRFSPKPSTNTLFRQLKARLIMPALFNGRQLQPLPYSVGYLPSRMLSLFIFLFVILNIVFSCVSYRLGTPNNVWYANTVQELSTYVANRTGVLSFANLGIAILFAGRNNLLLALTGWSPTTFITVHRWAARVATVQAIVHSIIYTAQYFWKDGAGAAGYAAEAALPYFWWGIIATAVLGIMIGLAVLPLRMWAYELFLFTHIVLAILALVGCWYHMELRYSKQWGYEVWLYLCFAFWAFDRTVRLVKVAIFNNWFTGSYDISKSSVQRISGPEDIVELTLFLDRRRWEKAIGAGMHTFLYFPSSGKFWESHPFTIADWGTVQADDERPDSSLSLSEDGSVLEQHSDSEKVTAVTVKTKAITSRRDRASADTGRFYIKFLTRIHRGSTRSLLQHNYPLIWTEGPYAGHMQTLHPLLTADTVLCIAGGVGISFALGFVKQYLNVDTDRDTSAGSEDEASSTPRALMDRTTRFILAWSAREEGLIRHVTEQMLPRQARQGQRRGRSVDVRIWHTDAGVSATTSGPKAPSNTTGEKDLAMKSARLASDPTAASSASSSDRSPSCAADGVRDTLPGLDISLTHGARMPIAAVLASSLEHGRHTAVLVCAPGGMADAVRHECVRATRDGPADLTLMEEAFAW